MVALVPLRQIDILPQKQLFVECCDTANESLTPATTLGCKEHQESSRPQQLQNARISRIRNNTGFS